VRSFTLRLPDAMVAEIEAEARSRGISKSEVVRRRLARASIRPTTVFDLAADLIGGVDDDRIPSDLTSRRSTISKAEGTGSTDIGDLKPAAQGDEMRRPTPAQ
jgi:hypothetical protein